ncbi:MAG: PD40 domain-containing protein [Blastocatellia bacterium]|nr:PD40 domain-containing protein [Blastocatellia bacterium]
MSQSSNNLYRFGPFRLDAAERVLWRGEELIVLPPKVFDTLWTLVRESGRVVTKAELMEAVWADAAVEESNLSQNIYTLRRALGVDEEGRQFIETIPRRGYRFAAPVKLLVEDSNGGASANDSQASSTAPTQFVTPATPMAIENRPRSASRFALMIGLGVLVLFSLSFGIYQFISRREEKKRIAPIEQVRLQRLTDSGDIVYPTISPDGKLLAYVRLADKGGSVWIKQIAATGSGVQVLPASHKSYSSLAFSPDGQYLFFREQAGSGSIYRTAAFGGEPEKIADDVWSDFSVSPNGRQLAFIRRYPDRNAQSLILSEIGGAERVLGARQAPQEYGESAPGWSPDGLKLAVSDREEQRHLLVVDALTGEERKLHTALQWRALWKALWTPDGKYLVFSARAIDEPVSQLWMLSYPDGEVRRLTNDLEGYFWLSLSLGKKLVTRQQKLFSQLWLLPEGDLNKARQLTFGMRDFDGYDGLAWTPDGRVVFSSFVNNKTNLYSMNSDGSNRMQLTATGPDNIYPVVSPDGRYIVFTSNRTGARQIWRMDNDGRNQNQLTQQNGSAQYPALSPDGREVFFIRREAGLAEICRIPIGGGTPVSVSRLTGAAAEGFLSISPDGKLLAYHQISIGRNAREEETKRIAVIAVDGTAEPWQFDLPMPRPLTHWSADCIDYISGTFNISSLLRQRITGGEPQKLCDFTDRVFNFAWSLDRKNLVVSRGDLKGDALLITNLP